PRARPDLDLGHARHPVFDGILERDDVAPLAVERAERGEERGALAGPGRPGDEQEPVAAAEQAAEQLELRRGEPHILEARRGFGEEQTEHGLSAVVRGERGDAERQLLAGYRQSYPAVLGPALDRDVQVGHDLDPGHDGASDAPRQLVELT